MTDGITVKSHMVECECGWQSHALHSEEVARLAALKHANEHHGGIRRVTVPVPE